MNSILKWNEGYKPLLLNLIMAWVTQIHFPNVIYFDNSMERHESLQGGLQVNIHRQAPSSKSETIQYEKIDLKLLI